MATPDDGYPPDAPTRLVGDGRIAVRVPVVWPNRFWGPVTQSCVKLRARGSVPAVLFRPPLTGTLAVHLQSGRYAMHGEEAEPLREGWRPIVLDDPMLRAAERHRFDPFERRRRRARTITSVSITSTDGPGSIDLEGDGDLARTVAATAHRIEPGLLVVPNPFDGPAPGIYRRLMVEEKATARLAIAGLRAVVHHDHAAGTRTCRPMWGEVVPLGSEVHVTIGPDRDND